jgi:hypothetical protein
MADLARILALPPPRSYGAAAHAAGRQLRPVEAARGDGASTGLPVRQADGIEDPADLQSDGQAKRFRFRVYDGAGRDTQSTDLRPSQNGAANGRRGAASGPAAEASATQPPAGRPQNDPNASGRSEPKALATFLAQLIAQEQLGQGLHAPPVKAADIAYRRAGGEPSIDIGSPARFSLAV